MGKKLKSREARRRDVERAICAVLEAHSKRDVGPRAVERYDNFKPEYHNKIRTLCGYALRAPEDWRCRIKSRSEERRFIDLVRFSFARYRVAAHLENAWLDEFTDDLIDRVAELPDTRAGHGNRPDLRRWYLVAAQGGSLYKQHTSPFLTKLETHHFVSARRRDVEPAGALVCDRTRAGRGRRDRAPDWAKSARSPLDCFLLVEGGRTLLRSQSCAAA